MLPSTADDPLGDSLAEGGATMSVFSGTARHSAAYFQTPETNSYAGGIDRHYQPITALAEPSAWNTDRYRGGRTSLYRDDEVITNQVRGSRDVMIVDFYR
ncbi:hypothetical protein [Nocardia sp. NPDC057227]|uniref:hypothetical protein n=1 Tax=Nocardia sp. NPDC057227 TaxID=3346056 RepID=UPI00363FE6BC